MVKRKNLTFVEVGVGSSEVDSFVQKKNDRRPDIVAARTIDFLATVIKQQKPDIFFLNGFSVFAWMLFEAARKTGTPIIIQHAGIFAQEVRQYSQKFSPQGRRACYWMERQTARYAHANIFLNETSRDVFSSTLRIQKIAGSEIIPLPHPGWKFVAKKRRHDDDLSIGCVARWDRIKNHDGLLAFAHAAHAMKLPWKFYAVTTIPDTTVRADFKKDYRSVIHVVPKMNRVELKKFYERIDVLLVPSHFETGPFVVLEAAACGVPALISPRIGWTSEYRKQGMKDWIVDFAHPYTAVRTLRDLMSRTHIAETTKFAKWLEMGHSPETIYQSYLRLFRRCSSR